MIEFAAVGALMLAIVLVFYLRMVDTRMQRRKPSDPIRQALEEADIYESVADDLSALETVEKALQSYPEHPQLLARQAHLRQNLSD